MPAALPSPAAIAVDWGTSNVRAMLLDRGGQVLDTRTSGDGIGRLQAGQHEAAFMRLVGGWPEVPAIMAGMIGSRQGWHEAAYVPCPADAASLAANVLGFTSDTGRRIAIVPGVMLRSAARDGDVIRGEETQIVGLLDRQPGFEGLAILPGTHSKWATVGGGALLDFQTFITGEMFELLSRHSFLRHSVAKDGGDLAARPDFALAIRRTAEAELPFLAALFSVRVRSLLDGADPADNLAYLSGLVIGGEIAAARASGRLTPGVKIRIVGSKSLARAYRTALHDRRPGDRSAGRDANW